MTAFEPVDPGQMAPPAASSAAPLNSPTPGGSSALPAGSASGAAPSASPS